MNKLTLKSNIVTGAKWGVVAVTRVVLGATAVALPVVFFWLVMKMPDVVFPILFSAAGVFACYVVGGVVLEGIIQRRRQKRRGY